MSDDNLFSSEDEEVVDHIPLKVFPDDEVILPNYLKGDDRISPQFIPIDDLIRSEEQEGYDRLPPQEISEND